MPPPSRVRVKSISMRNTALKSRPISALNFRRTKKQFRMAPNSKTTRVSSGEISDAFRYLRLGEYGMFVLGIGTGMLR